MREIHCPKDIGFNNIFVGEDCKKEQWYDNCYHCWSSAIAENNQEYFKRKFKEELKKLKKEIHKLAFDDEDGDYMGLIDDDEVMKLIDNYIPRLKGE